MHRLPLSDQFPYRFQRPRHNPFCVWLGHRLGRTLLKHSHKVAELDFPDLTHLRSLLDQGDGILLTPNHTDHADAHLMFELSRQLGRCFFAMGAFQLFQKHRGWFLPRVGIFPVDREGADITAFKTGVDILARSEHPLVIFPEGEIYHLADRLTPLREGAVAVAAAAARRLSDRGRTVWIVPVALKYRFLEHVDPTNLFHTIIDELERRLSWWPQRHLALVDRIHHYAEAILNLKEFEYLGEPQRGSLPERIAGLREWILQRVEQTRLAGARRRADGLSVPERVKELRRTCLDALADEKTSAEDATAIRRDLHDIFTAVQLYSYPGNYVRESPTLERVSETLMKCQEDFLGIVEVPPHGARRAHLRLGQPIDVRARMASTARPRDAVASITNELEAALQALLDTIGPGRFLPEAAFPAPTPPASTPEARIA